MKKLNKISYISKILILILFIFIIGPVYFKEQKIVEEYYTKNLKISFPLYDAKAENLWNNKIVRGASFSVMNTFRIINNEDECTKYYTNVSSPYIYFESNPSKENIEYEICSFNGNGKITFQSYELFISIANNAPFDFYFVNTPKGTINFEVVDNPKISLSSHANYSSVLAGDNVTFTIKVQNTGEYIMNNVILEDILDSNLSFINSSISPTLNNGKYVFNLPSIEPNKSYDLSITCKVKDNVTPNTVLENKVTVKADYAEAKSITSNVTVSSPPQIENPTFTLSSTPSKTKIKCNEIFSYIINIKNTSTVNAKNVKINSIISSNLEVIDSGGATNNNGNLIWITDMKAKETRRYIIKVKAKENLVPGTIINNNTILLYDNNEVLNTTNIVEIEETKINVTISPDKNSVSSGDTIYYTIKIQNDNDVAVKNITIRQMIDENLIIESAPNGEINNQEIIYKLEVLEAHEEVTYTIKVKAKNTEGDIIIDNKTEVDEDGSKNIITNENDIIIKPNENIPNKDINDIENPSTGLQGLICIILLAIILLSYIAIKIKREKKIYKI